ncbi:MAG: hypothetical protein MR424_08035, partial [Treponema sp.]|nr:hypothetical protein [Treponema sp.]
LLLPLNINFSDFLPIYSEMFPPFFPPKEFYFILKFLNSGLKLMMLTGTNRVIRGGSFTSWNNEECTVSYRESQTPNARYVTCGFRVVRNAL